MQEFITQINNGGGTPSTVTQAIENEIDAKDAGGKPVMKVELHGIPTFAFDLT